MNEFCERILKIQEGAEAIPDAVKVSVEKLEADLAKMGNSDGTLIPRLALIQQAYIGRLEARVSEMEGTLLTLVKSNLPPSEAKRMAEAVERAKGKLEGR